MHSKAILDTIYPPNSKISDFETSELDFYFVVNYLLQKKFIVSCMVNILSQPTHSVYNLGQIPCLLLSAVHALAYIPTEKTKQENKVGKSKSCWT